MKCVIFDIEIDKYCGTTETVLCLVERPDTSDFWLN